MVGYLVLFQCASLTYLLRGADRARMVAPVLIAQVAMLGLFWLAWGGYSIDGWRYWWRFEQSPFSLDTDRLFWIAGWLVQKVVDYPWSMRILSMLGALVFAGGIWCYFGRARSSLVVLAYTALPVVPIFFLGFGNAIRQGLAAAVFLLGFSLFRAGSKRGAAIYWLTALFVHLPVIVLLAAALAGRYAGRFCVALVVVFPLAGLLAHWLVTTNGFSLELIVRYSENAAGSFHYLKYVVHMAVVAFTLLLVRGKNNGRDDWLVDTYCCSVAFASLFLLYEVPLERLLMYSEIFLPLVAALMFKTVLDNRRLAVAGWVLLIIAGVGLWTHPSINSTLGL